MTLLEKTYDLNIEDFKNYSINKLFTIQSEAYELNIDTTLINIKKFIKSIFISEYEYVIKYNNSYNEILFFYSHFFYRNDHFNTFINFTNGLDIGDVLYPIRKKHNINIKKSLKLSLKCISWLKHLRNQNMNFREKIIVLHTLLEAKKFIEIIDKINIGKYKMLSVYYDVNPIDNLLVQYFKSENKVTSTLQHGSFIAKRNNCKNFESRGIELSNCISDFFLAWNEFTKDEAIKAGIKNNNIKVLGIPKYLNLKSELDSNEIQDENKFVFGLILGTKGSQVQNLALINIANKISRDMNYKYKIKFHPSFEGNEYDDYIDKKFYAGYFDKYSTITDYIRTVKFSLVGNSSVYIELIYLKHTTYRIVGVGDFDKFIDIKENTFTSYSDLEKILQNKENDNEVLFEYLCTVTNIKNSYLDFFINTLNKLNEG